MNDKWKMFKNFMYNELRVSKSDIRGWIAEAVNIEAEKLIRNTYKKYDIEKMLRDILREEMLSYGHFTYEFKQAVAGILAEQITLEIKQKRN